MGALSLAGMRQMGLPERETMRWHLTCNCFPPVPEMMVSVAIEAVQAARGERWDEEIPLPEGVHHRKYGDRVPARAIVEAWRLEGFIDGEESA